MVNMNNQISESTKRFLSLQNPWFFAPAEIIHQDENLIVVDKPIGLSVHQGIETRDPPASSREASRAGSQRRAGG